MTIKCKVSDHLEIEYEEGEDGIFYPLIEPVKTPEEQLASVGKFGRMWARYMEIEFPMRYRALMRNEELGTVAAEVDELANEVYIDITENWVKNHRPAVEGSFVEIYRIRSQAAMMAEEMVLAEIVNMWH